MLLTLNNISSERKTQTISVVASINDGMNWINISDLEGHKSEAVINYNV